MIHSSPDSADTTHLADFPQSTDGPQTLHQKIGMQHHILQIKERVSYGNGFMPAESLHNTRQRLDDSRARMELVLEAHPELDKMNERHRALLQKLHNPEPGEFFDATALKQEIATLAQQIVDLESSIDLG